jgi:hypothetical protein
MTLHTLVPRTVRAAPLLLAATALAACSTVEPEPLDGTLTVSWQVGTQGCEASGVSDVEVEVDGRLRSAACTQGELSMTVPAGDHRVSLWGIDAGGVARYEGSASASVYEGEAVTLPTVVLGGIPAAVDVTWYFENGRLCGGNGVEDVEIVVFDDDFIVTSLATTCDDGIERLGGLQSGLYTLSVLGRDESGTIQFSGSEMVDVDKGDLAVVEVMLASM